MKLPRPSPFPEYETFICYDLLFLPEIFSFIFQTQHSKQKISHLLSDHLLLFLCPPALRNPFKANFPCMFFGYPCSPHHSQWEDCTFAMLLVLRHLSFLSPHHCPRASFIISCLEHFRLYKKDFFEQLFLDILEIGLTHFLGNFSDF